MHGVGRRADLRVTAVARPGIKVTHLKRSSQDPARTLPQLGAGVGRYGGGHEEGRARLLRRIERDARGERLRTARLDTATTGDAGRAVEREAGADRDRTGRTCGRTRPYQIAPRCVPDRLGP